MKEIIIYLLSKYGYISCIFLIAIENLLPPIPSEFILVFCGLLAKISNLNLVLLIIFSTLGSLFGALILYYLGYIFGDKLINSKILIKLGFNISKLKESINTFKESGYFTIFICRCIPMIRSLISIPAGIAKMNLYKFTILTTLGSLIWNTIFILLGNMFNNYSEIVLYYLDKYSLLFIILPIIYYQIKKTKN